MRLAFIRTRVCDAIARARKSGLDSEAADGEALLAYLDSVEEEIRGAEIVLPNGLRLIGHASPEQRAFFASLPETLARMIDHVAFAEGGAMTVNLTIEDRGRAVEFDRHLRAAEVLFFAGPDHGNA